MNCAIVLSIAIAVVLTLRVETRRHGNITGSSSVHDRTGGQNRMIKRVIVVDASGQGQYTGLQQAINSVPSGNKDWVCIILKPGRYREKITIPSDKPFILLQGGGRKETEISFDGHQGTMESATFTVSADNFVASGVSFTNTYNHPSMQQDGDAMQNKNPRTQAVAVEIFGDKVAFYDCGFFGLQDTLCDFQGRHYFKNCYIEGAVDFIFGHGQSIYEDTAISVIEGHVDGAGQGLRGYITAQQRQKPNDPDGFVFKGCTIFGNGQVYLGRPWGPYGRVLFYNTEMSKVVVPEGWAEAFGFNGQDCTFAEVGCHGAGSDMTKRVPWEKKLSESETNQLVSMSYINGDGWLEQQPQPQQGNNYVPMTYEPSCATH